MDDQEHTKTPGCCGCGAGRKTTAPVATTAVKDPVCGKTVDLATSRHRAENEGTAYYFCCGGCLAKFQADPGRYTAPRETATVTDPVCGMKVDPRTAKHRHEHGGKTYLFCSVGCQAKFEAEPAKYLVKKAAAPKAEAVPAKPGDIYTCPMHPQIRQQGPGSCPICGMALEPVEVTSEAPPTRRLRDDSDDEEIPVDQVAVGDKLRIRPGDGVPVDGVILEGTSAVDESMVSGESMPAAKEKGGKLIGGTVNGAGALVMRAEEIGADTMLARIVAMVADAQRSRAPIQRMADTVAGWFVPVVLLAAAGDEALIVVSSKLDTPARPTVV